MLRRIVMIFSYYSDGRFVLGGGSDPSGAERAGSKDRDPAWEGKEAPVPGWAYGKVRGDYWKHKGEKPLFSIDASNVDKYKDKLSPGQVQLVKQTKGYRMDVYPSHRNADFPDFIQANTKKNAAGNAKLSADGAYLKEADSPGDSIHRSQIGRERRSGTTCCATRASVSIIRAALTPSFLRGRAATSGWRRRDPNIVFPVGQKRHDDACPGGGCLLQHLLPVPDPSCPGRTGTGPGLVLLQG